MEGQTATESIYGLMERADRIAGDALALDREQRIKHDRVMQLSREIMDFLKADDIYFIMALANFGDEGRARAASRLAGFLEERLHVRPKRDESHQLLLDWLHHMNETILFLRNRIKFLEGELAEERAKNVYGRMMMGTGEGGGQGSMSVRA